MISFVFSILLILALLWLMAWGCVACLLFLLRVAAFPPLAFCWVWKQVHK